MSFPVGCLPGSQNQPDQEQMKASSQEIKIRVCLGLPDSWNKEDGDGQVF